MHPITLIPGDGIGPEVASNVVRFSTRRMIRRRRGTYLSAIESATNIAVAFRSSAPITASISPLIRPIATRDTYGLRLAPRTIGGTRVLQVLVANGDRRIGATDDGDCGRHSFPLERHMVAKAVRILEHADEAKGNLAVQRPVDAS